VKLHNEYVKIFRLKLEIHRLYVIKHLPLSTHIIVGMSGGVDSSVTAYLLKNAGYSVEGVFMKNWEGDDTETYCPATQEMADAQAVCDSLKINLEMVNFASEYWERVFAYFLDEYRAGRTPNPDILCNKEIKFNAFLQYAQQRGADYIATGHYARTQSHEQDIQLLKGLDPQKDQSYFLYALDQFQLSHSLFPIGDITKQEVRHIAKEIGLNNHAKKDSTGICFIGERKFKQFLNEYLPAQPGVIITMDGEKIGQHEGLMFYTIGQRQGLQIGGKKGKMDAPWYVVEKDLRNNELIVAQGEHQALYKDQLIAGNIHWINGAPHFPLRVMAKTRYRQPDQMCEVVKLDEASVQVTFKQPQRAVTPGQAIVFYKEDICLGGGIIR
jgi:tRNA-specific 2-thiouridylase